MRWEKEAYLLHAFGVCVSHPFGGGILGLLLRLHLRQGRTCAHQMQVMG